MFELMLFASVAWGLVSFAWILKIKRNSREDGKDGWVQKRWEFRSQKNRTWASIELDSTKDSKTFCWSVGGLNWGTVKSGRTTTLSSAKSAALTHMLKD